MRRVVLFAAAFMLLAAGVTGAAQKQMSVTVKETQVRVTPGYLGKVLGTLVYGDRITLLDQPADTLKGWVKVLGPDKKLQGFVNLASLTEKQIALASSGGVQQSASSGDVALAGKGFNADVEAQYKQDQKLDYTWVDKMQGFQVPPEQVSAFLAQGGLTGQGGAQ